MSRYLKLLVFRIFQAKTHIEQSVCEVTRKYFKLNKEKQRWHKEDDKILVFFDFRSDRLDFLTKKGRNGLQKSTNELFIIADTIIEEHVTRC